jgi:ArsR family transcriptional regulator
MNTNMSVRISEISDPISSLLQVLGSPARIAILIAIGRGAACVCHLEAILGWRQAYISQHLMVLRKAEILQDSREGRYVYYRLKDEAMLTLVRAAARVSGLDPAAVDRLANPDPGPNCACPHCAAPVILMESLKNL